MAMKSTIVIPKEKPLILILPSKMPKDMTTA